MQSSNSYINSCVGNRPEIGLAAQNDSNSVEIVFSSLGIPREVQSSYKKLGVHRLYDWQKECLYSTDTLRGQNLVYCAPTSGGKTLVAELVMLKTVLVQRKKAIFVLPYVSLVMEKEKHLRRMINSLNRSLPPNQRIRIRGYYGSLTVRKSYRENISICTIEKANGIVNNMISKGFGEQLGCLVLDEMHVLGKQFNGHLLEILISKLKLYEDVVNRRNAKDQMIPKGTALRHIQIVALSATMGNVGELAEWLKARLYTTTFRPVALQETIKCGCEVVDLAGVRLSQLPPASSEQDPDHVVSLSAQALQKGQQVIIFCGSKFICQQTCGVLGEYLPQHLHNPEVIKHANNSLGEDTLIAARQHLLNEFKASSGNVDAAFAKAILAGVAYHHAGLTSVERTAVEKGFRKGWLSILTATSTLAAGVNLPAGCVIIRGMLVGREPLGVVQYKQMTGRAGRAGQTDRGDSILLVKAHEKERALDLVNQNMPDVVSQMSPDLDSGNALLKALLEVTGIGLCQSESDARLYVKNTLMFLQHCKRAQLANLQQADQNHSEEVLSHALLSLQFLLDERIVDESLDTSGGLDKKEKVLRLSRLGRAIIQSGVDPDEGIVMYRNLLRARDGLNLESLLHVLYLVTPLEHQLYPRFDLMLRQYSKSKNSGISAARIYAAVVDSVGIDTDVLHRWEVKPPSKLELEMCSSTIRLYEINHRTSNSTLTKQPKVRSTLSPDSWRVLCNSRQLWAASALQMVLDEAAPIDQIAKTYGVQAADIENLVHRTRVMASKVCRFCENIGWSTLGKLITDFKLVLDDFCSGHAANADLAPLLSVVRMPVKLARLLVEKCEICTPTEFILVAPEVVAQHLHKLHGFELKEGDMAADDLEWFESNSEEDDHFEKENTFVAESIGSRERNPSKKQETLDEQRRKRLVQWITFLQKETRAALEAVLVEKDRAECDVGDYRNNAVVNEEFSLIEEQEAEELLSDLSSVSSNSHSDSDIEKDVESGEEQELVNLLRADRAGGFTNIPEPSKPKAESVSNSAEKKTRKRTSRTPLRKPVLATQSADYSPANKIARGDYKKGTSPKLSMQISLLSSAASAVSSSSSKASIFQQEKTRVFHKSPKGVDENRRRSLQDAELAAMMEELESSEYIESQPYRARDEALAVRETAISYTAETDLSIVHRMDKALLSSQQQNLATQWSSQALFNSQILTQIESVQHWNIYEQEEDCNVLMDETEFSPSSLVPQKVVKNEEILSEIEGKSDAQEEGVITQAETDKLNKSFSNCRDEDLVAMMEAVEASCGLLFTQECDEIPAIGSTGVSYSLDEPTSPGAFFGIDSEDKFFCQDAIQDGAEKENEEFIANEDCNLLNPSPYLAPYTASKVKTPGRYLYYPLLEQDHMDCLYEGSGDEVSVSNLDCPAGATVVLDENESEVDAASSESVLSNTEAAAEANLRSVKRLSFSGALPSSPLKDVDKVAANKVAAQRYLFPLENISHVSMERQRGFAYRSLLSAYNCASFVRTMKFSKVVAFELVFRRIPKKFLTFRSHNWSNYWWSALSWSCSPAISVTCCDNDDFICYKQQSEVAVHPVGNNKKKTTSAAKRHEYLQTLMQQSTKPSTRGMTDSPHVLVGIALNFGDENSYYLPLPVCHTLPLDASQSVDGSSIITGVTPIDKRRGSLSLVPRRCRVLICRYVGFPVQFQQSIALHRLLHVDRDSRLSISEAINIVEDNNISACDSNGLTSNPLLLVSRDWYSAAREGMSVQWRKGGSLEWKLLSNIMSNPSITKVAINMKEKLVALRERDIIVEGILDDPALAMTLLQTSYPTANLDALVANMMIPPVPLEDHSASINTSGLFTTGVKSKRDGLLVRRGKRIAAFRSIAVMRFTSAVYALISSKNVFTLYRNIEMPLLGCVVEAEVAGMGIDMAFFSRIQSELEDRQEVINYYFRTIMGDHFNPDSPKDIGALKKRLVDHLCELHVAQEERALQARRIRQKAYATNGTGSIRDTSCSSYVIQNSSLEEWGSDAVKKSDHSSWEFCQQNDNLLVKSESAVRQRFQKLVKAFHPVMQLVSEHRRHSIMLPICGTIMRFTLGERCKALYHTIGTDTGRLIITSPPLQQSPHDCAYVVAKRKSLHDEILELQSGRFATDNVIDSTRANALNDLLFNGKISSGSNERFSSVADFTISKSTKHSGGRRVKVLCPAFDQLNKRADFAISFLSDWWITGTVSRVLERTVNDKYYTNAEQVARYGCACGVESTIALSNLQQFVSYKNDANVQQVIVEIDSSSLKSLGCGEAGTVVYYTFPADKVYRLSAGVSPDRAEVSAINTSLLEPFMEGLLQKYYKDEDLLIPEDQGAIEDGEATTQQPDADDSPISAVELAAIRGLPNAVVLPFRQGFIAERNLHEHHSRQFVLLTADYAQVELRLLAHFSSDKNLCAAISSGKDVFRTIAAEWHGIEGTEVSSKTRDHVKRVCYAVIYGAGAKLVAEQCGIPADAAVSLMNDFLKKFSGIKSFIANCKRLCRQRGYVETLLGRRRALPDIKSSVQNKKARAERQAVNTLCQGSAADLIKLAMINIHSRLRSLALESQSTRGIPSIQYRRPRSNPGGGLYKTLDDVRLVLQVHDELIYEVRRCDVSKVAAIVKECMENAVQLLVPLQVKLSTGSDWGNLQPYDL